MESAFANESAAKRGWASRSVYVGAMLGAVAALALGSRSVPTPSVVHAETQTAIETSTVPPAAASAARVRNPVKAFGLKNLTNGMASWYGQVFETHRTASGRTFDMTELTAAHRSLPFGSRVKVTDLRNRRSVVVTITDRGIVNHADRVIDLSYAAAQKLDMVRSGVDRVSLELLQPISRAGMPVMTHR